jgi:hypothetical protein
MFVQPSDAWKVALAVALGAAILLSAYARAPRRAVSGADLRRLMLAAVMLYVTGGLASLTGHPALGVMVCGAGITVCALAAWLSRGRDSDGPRGRREPAGDEPPPDPDGPPQFDWATFEREFRAYTRRPREPAGRR